MRDLQIQDLPIDEDYLLDVLRRLLETPSPSGMTDTAVMLVCDELDSLDIDYGLTRRGAVRATLKGQEGAPDRAIVGHLDTLGAMVKGIRGNGRLELVPIGTWSARFAEGARVTVFSEQALYRGTVLPLKASGHTFNEEIDTQPRPGPMSRCGSTPNGLGGRHAVARASRSAIRSPSIPQSEFGPNGYINSRHLDDKAGVAAILAAAKAARDAGATFPIDCHLLFTISEEVGVGASSILHGDVAELYRSTTAPSRRGNTPASAA